MPKDKSALCHIRVERSHGCSESVCEAAIEKGKEKGVEWLESKEQDSLMTENDQRQKLYVQMNGSRGGKN